MPELESGEPIRSLEEIAAYPLPADVYLQVLNREKLPFILSHLLKGEAYDPEKDKWIQTGKPLANNEGVRTVITIVNSYVGVDKIATNLSEEKINEICYNLRLDITEKFFQCWKDFAISKSDLSLILDIVMDFIECNLRGSLNATILKLLQQTAIRKEIIAPERKRHWWESIPLMGGK